MLVGDQANLQILLGEVREIDPKERSIAFNGTHLRYDHLVLATGSGSTYLGHEEWRALAPPMKILEHAEEIRRRLLMALEEAERTVDASQRRFLQTVVVVGSGPSGCELAGSVAELMRRALARDFRRVDPEQTRVVLVVSGGRVLKELPELLSEAAAADLRAKGIELVPGRVVAMQPGEVVIRPSKGEELTVQAANVFWTAGVRASKLGHRLAEATGCALDRGGRVIVEPDFSIPGHPEIRVVGDLCHYAHAGADGQPIPAGGSPAPPVPLRGFGQHGRAGAPQCGGQSARHQAGRFPRLGAVGPRPPGLHARRREQDHAAGEVVVGHPERTAQFLADHRVAQ
jgi:NADH dehydrogenase